MNGYEQQPQTPAQHYNPNVRDIEHRDGDASPMVAGSDSHVYEWADVLKDLELYY